MSKAFKVKLTDEAGRAYSWTVKSFQGVWNCGGTLIAGRKISGWSYTDHEGVTRNVEGNWLALVAAFRVTAENYGFATSIS